MGADNWRELLDDPEVVELVRRAARIEGTRLYASPRDALLRDDLESWMWDESVSIAKNARDHLQPRTAAWYGFLYACLRTTALQRHRVSHWGYFGGAGFSAHARSIASLDNDNASSLLLHNIAPRLNDPLSYVLRCEALEEHIVRAEARQLTDGVAWQTASHTCTEPMCDRPQHAKGLCPQHYNLQRDRWGTQATPACTTDGCERPAVGRGLCHRHYKRWQRSNPDTPRCSAESCQRPAVSHGMCSKHYQRARRKGDV